MELKIGTGMFFEARKTILTSDFENFHTAVSYNAMSSWEKYPQIIKNGHKNAANGDFDLKIGTSMFFGARKTILASDFDNFDGGVSYNAMSSGG